MFERYLLESGLASRVAELKGKTLLCHCPPGARCHGDILVEHAERSTGPQGIVEAGGAFDDDGLPTRLPADPGEEADYVPEVACGGWRGRGPPRRTQAMGRARPFHDGGGLCSPGRWDRDRRVLPEGVGGTFFSDVKGLVRDFWAEQSGGKDELHTFVLRLAAGQVVENPFREEVIQKGLVLLCRAFGLSEADFGSCAAPVFPSYGPLACSSGFW